MRQYTGPCTCENDEHREIPGVSRLVHEQNRKQRGEQEAKKITGERSTTISFLD
jgi:hypothetical protein